MRHESLPAPQAVTETAHEGPSALLGAYTSVIERVLLGSLVLPVVVVACSRYDLAGRFGADVLAEIGPASAVALVAFYCLRGALRSTYSHGAIASRQQVIHLDRLPRRSLLAAIAASAALSLLLELAIIRWQSSVFEFYAFYKNVGLLSCFVGLGIGYALARREEIPLFAVAPLIAWQVLLLTAMRYGFSRPSLESLRVNPFHEILTMGILNATKLAHYVAVYSLVIVVFALSAIAFVPIGQLCGRLMDRCEPLSAYGMNLAGSVLGVVVMLSLSMAWAPPAAWFALCFAALLLFQTFDRATLIPSACAAIVAVTVLAWPVSVGWERIFSPYQLLERGADPFGATTIRAAGHFYQTIFDLGEGRRSTLEPIARYYDLPYRLHARGAEVAVVGAGSGNDVAAALRSGATRVDAVEIDPAILRIGELYHPEKPYQDGRVHEVVDDARSFLRNARASYDLIVYGLVDSHAILSQASSVRLDSFVYTVEGLREARTRLKPGGTMSLSFLVLTPELGRKIFEMMTAAFDGREPLCLTLVPPGATIFLQGRDARPTIPSDSAAQGFRDVTSRYADPTLRADVSTDDWPFFYMPRRIFPLSYVALLVVLLVAAFAFAGRFLKPAQRASQPAFFFLGAGFMLVETKGITELGLTFGNTWYVIGVVICGVLAMAFAANWLTQTLSIEGRMWPFALLVASLAVGFAVSRAGGLPSTASGRLATTALLTCPLFFSGLMFSSLLRRSSDLSGAMGQNVLGAMLGGVLEYNSMYFGFAALYLIAILFYAAAFATSRPRAARAGADFRGQKAREMIGLQHYACLTNPAHPQQPQL
jgi:hypothetical protein